MPATDTPGDNGTGNGNQPAAGSSQKTLTVNLTVGTDASGNATLSAEPTGGNVDIPNGWKDVELVFRLTDPTGHGWKFLASATHDAQGDHYHGIEIVGDNDVQFRNQQLLDDGMTVKFTDLNTDSRSFLYSVMLENGSDKPLLLDPTIKNQN